MLTNMSDDIQSKWCLKIVKKIKEDLHPYSKLKWQSFESASKPDQLSEQILRLLQTLKAVVKSLSSNMDQKGAEKWIKKLAVKLDEV